MSLLSELLKEVPASLRALVGIGLALAENRLELAGLELQEEKARILGLLAALLAGLFLGMAGLAVLIVGLALLLGPEGRLWLLLCAGGVFLLASLALLLGARSSLRRHRPFSQSLAELRKDRRAL